MDRSQELVKILGVKNSCILCALCYLNNTQRKQVIHNAENDLIKCICECSLNILNGNLEVTTQQKNKLKKFKKVLRNLSASRGSVKRKKKIIQKGGAAFLPLLLAPIIGELISHFALGQL